MQNPNGPSIAAVVTWPVSVVLIVGGGRGRGRDPLPGGAEVVSAQVSAQHLRDPRARPVHATRPQVPQQRLRPQGGTGATASDKMTATSSLDISLGWWG